MVFLLFQLEQLSAEWTKKESELEERIQQLQVESDKNSQESDKVTLIYWISWNTKLFYESDNF